MHKQELAELSAAFASDVERAHNVNQDSLKSLLLCSDAVLSYADDISALEGCYLEQAGTHILAALEAVIDDSMLHNVGPPPVLAAWPEIEHVIQILTRACPNLQQSIDEFWYAQTHHLQYFGSSTHACQQQYIIELAQMQQGLPMLLELSIQAREVCSMPLLDELEPQAAIAITVQLLLCQHQPSAAVKQLLSDTLQHGCHEPVDNNRWHAQSGQDQPQQLQSYHHQGTTQHVVLLWSTALACVQEHVKQLHRYSEHRADDFLASTACLQVFQLLWSWRSTANGQQWDACLVATAEGFASTAAEKGPSCLSQRMFEAVSHVAVQPQTAPLWLRAMIAHESASSLKGMRKQLAAFGLCCKHSPQALLLGCAELLKPESNLPVATRMEALLAMERAVTQYEEANKDIGEEVRQLWPDAAVQMLLYTLGKDPSVRIRRAAMSLLTSVPSQHESAQLKAIVQLLVLKCRDRDAAVQQQAYSMLAQLPGDTLLHTLSIEEWRVVLDTALLPPALSDNALTEQQLQEPGRKLLRKWLRFDHIVGMRGDEVCCRYSAELQTTLAVQSAAYLRALQIPWCHNAMYQAYFTALQS